MLGGLGHTSFVGSKLNLRGPVTSDAGASAFFFLAACAGDGRAAPSASSRSNAAGFDERIGWKRKLDISISSQSQFPGVTVSFMLSRFLWQLSQKAVLFC